MQTIRSFVAVGISKAVESEIERIAGELTRTFPARAIRWVRPEAIHLTLRFLGDTPIDKLPLVAQALDRVAAAHQKHNLYLGGLGCFPNSRRPRVIWIGLEGDIEPVQVIHRDLSDKLSEIGWESDRRKFRPHLTLGRVKDLGAVARTNFNWNLRIRPLPFSLSELTLFESTLRPSGATYDVRHSVVLQDPE